LRDVTWRVTAAGLVSRSLVTPLLALVLAYVVALVLEQARVLRALAVVSGLGAVGLLAAIGLFAMDALVVRTQITAPSRPAYDVAVMLAFVKLSVGVVLLAGLVVAGWRAASTVATGGGRLATKSSGMLLHRKRGPSVKAPDPESLDTTEAAQPFEATAAR
jgi:hypothetical protein